MKNSKIRTSLILFIIILMIFSQECYATGLINMQNATLSMPNDFDYVWDNFNKNPQTTDKETSKNPYEGLVGEEAFKRVEEASKSGEITIESARRQIAEWGLKFKTEEGVKWRYKSIYNVNDLYDPGVKARRETYKGGYHQSSYGFDCVGCVSYIIHYSIGINFSGAETGKSGFVTPGGARDTAHFESHDIGGSFQPEMGDILIMPKPSGRGSGHVAIYCGDGRIVDYGKSREISTVDTGSWKDNNNHTYTKFARLISIDGASFSPIEGGIVLPTPGADGEGEVDLDEIAERFKYHGMPTKIEYQKEETDVFRWIFDGVTGLVDFLAGLLLSIIRIPIVGITSFVESKINDGIRGANE